MRYFIFRLQIDRGNLLLENWKCAIKFIYIYYQIATQKNMEKKMLIKVLLNNHDYDKKRKTYDD